MMIAKKCKSCTKKCKLKVSTAFTELEYCPGYVPKRKSKGKK